VQARSATPARLLDKPSEHATSQRRRDLVHELMKGAQAWHRGIVKGLRHALLHGVSATRPGDLPPPGSAMSLVDDDTIELEIVTSRLALAIMDRASWEFSDLRSRVAHLEQRAELDPHDLLRAHVLARIVVDAWRAAGHAGRLARAAAVLHEEFALLVEEATTRPTAGWSSRACCPRSTCGPSSSAARARGAPAPAARRLAQPQCLRRRASAAHPPVYAGGPTPAGGGGLGLVVRLGGGGGSGEAAARAAAMRGLRWRATARRRAAASATRPA
jgi:hypothetical protein